MEQLRNALIMFGYEFISNICEMKIHNNRTYPDNERSSWGELMIADAAAYESGCHGIFATKSCAYYNEKRNISVFAFGYGKDNSGLWRANVLGWFIIGFKG